MVNCVRWLLLLAPVLIPGGCVGTMPRTAPGPLEAGTAGPAAHDSVINLQRHAPPDPIVLDRAGFTILLSTEDVEAYYAQWPLSPEEAQFREEIRRRSATSSRVELEESELADILAGGLMESGQAAIRPSPRGRWLPWVRSVLELSEHGTTVVRHRVFFAPDGTLILRIPDGVTVS